MGVFTLVILFLFQFSTIVSLAKPPQEGFNIKWRQILK
jgi:hypothetical protein